MLVHHHQSFKKATKLMYLITLFMTINLLLRLTLGILITIANGDMGDSKILDTVSKNVSDVIILWFSRRSNN